MNKFCRLFFIEQEHDIEQCQQCSRANADVKELDRILATVEGPLVIRTELEKAALDHRGRP